MKPIYQSIVLIIALAFSALAPVAYAEQSKTEAVVLASININTATVETLASELKGVGEKKAQAIVEYRNQHGPFKTVGELEDVKGIGKAIVQSNANRLSVE